MLLISWAEMKVCKMNHKDEFEKRAGTTGESIELFLFGWVDGEGNGGDYGLNNGPAINTLTTLINTTYMFQPEPKFTLQGRKFLMTPAQFEYLQDHDLDTQDFLSSIGPLPDVEFELDLSQYSDAASALAACNELGG
jgi:hypothetical protein